MRILLVSLILPLLAFVLWWPLSALPRAVRWRRIGLSLLVALLLPAMVVVWRSDMLGYAAISWLQVGAGGLVLLGMLLLVFVIVRTAGWGGMRCWSGCCGARRESACGAGMRHG